MYQFQFKYDFQDLLTLNRIASKCYRRWQTLIFRITGVLVGLLALLLAGVMLWTEGFSTLALFNLIFGILLPVAGIFYHQLNALQSKRMLIKDTGELTVTLEEDGARECSKKGEGFYPWNAIIAGYHSHGRYLLFLDKKHAAILPERGLTHGDSATLKAFLEKKLQKEVKEIP